MKGVGNMEKKLLATYESEKGIVRFFAGDQMQSLDDLNEAIKEPALEFAHAVRRSLTDMNRGGKHDKQRKDNCL